MAENVVDLPAGLKPLPELGADTVGTSVAGGARVLAWVKAAVWLMLLGFALLGAVQSIEMLAGLVLAVILVGACAFLAAGNLGVAFLADRPALTFDAENLHCHVPLNRVSIRLASITRVERLRRDVLIEAKGGVSRHGRPSRARWVGLSRVNLFEVSRADLITYLEMRAEAVRGPE